MRASRKSLPIVVLVPLLSVACGGGGGADADNGGATAAESDAYTVPAAEAAVITGIVRFEGTAPAPEPIDMSAEPTCAEKHAGSGAFRTPVAVNQNGTLRNVFIYVREGLPAQNYAGRDEAVVIDQVGCEYTPHITGVRTNHDIIFRNSDGLLHNVNTTPQNNRPFNISQPTSMDAPPRRFSQAEVMVPIRCDVHGWMEGYIGVVDHPFFAVTGDDGSFRIEGLPPGTYTIEAWHEQYGTQTTQVTVAAQETGQATFTYSSDMAGAYVPMGAPIDPHDHGRVASATH